MRKTEVGNCNFHCKEIKVELTDLLLRTLEFRGSDYGCNLDSAFLKNQTL